MGKTANLIRATLRGPTYLPLIMSVLVAGCAASNQNRLSDFYAPASLQPFLSANPPQTLAQPAVTTISESATAGRSKNSFLDRIDRHIGSRQAGERSIHISELEVYGIDTQTTPPACSDGTQNQDETGVDCGGSACAACTTQFWTFPTADHTVEQVWAELPNQLFTDIEDFQGNQDPPFTWQSHTPGPFLELTDQGLEFIWDPDADKSAFPVWLQYRSELTEPFTNSVVLGTTSVFATRFEVNILPAPLTGPVTIFQRFRDDLDRPDLDVELACTGQFRDAEPNSVLVHAEGDTWKRPNVFLNGPGQTNDLVVAMENKQEGAYRVSLNGQTIAQGTGNFAPATPTTFTAPKFGIYNHGGNQEYFKFTHKRYGRYTYNQTPDFDQINASKRPEPPAGLRIKE